MHIRLRRNNFSCFAVIDYEFVQNPLSATINAGQTLILRSSPPRRYPISVKISWYWNYSLLKKSANVIIMTDGSLQIVAVTKSHEGVYFCEAENPVTSERRTSKTATVSVRGTYQLVLIVISCDAFGKRLFFKE